MDWDIVPVTDQNGIILTYTVTYKALAGGIPQSTVVIAPTTQANLSGLTKYRSYSITVFASTAKGDGNASEPIIVITDEDSKLSIAVAHFQTLIYSYEKIMFIRSLQGMGQWALPVWRPRPYDTLSNHCLCLANMKFHLQS